MKRWDCFFPRKPGGLGRSSGVDRGLDLQFPGRFGDWERQAGCWTKGYSVECGKVELLLALADFILETCFEFFNRIWKSKNKVRSPDL